MHTVSAKCISYKAIMDNAKLLHIHVPMVAHLPQSSALLSVIGNTPDQYAWIMSSFINLRVNKALEYDDFYRSDMWYNCYYIEDNSMTRQFIVNNTTSDFAHFVVECINNGYYIMPYINKKYITAYNYNYDMRHSPLIYGYNLSKRIIYLSDFFKWHYEQSTASFNELNQSVDYHENEHDWYPYKLFRIFKKKEGYQYRFNLEHIIRQLKDYCSSTNMNGTYEQFQTNDMEEKPYFNIMDYQKTYFGISCYDAFLELITSKVIWARLFYLFRAHKILMRKRLEYLNSRYEMMEYDHLYEMVNKMEAMSTRSQNMYIKFRATNKMEYIDKIFEQIINMKEIDRVFSEKLISVLEVAKLRNV